MSWFKRALSISTPLPNAYYTTVDPGEFYEWRFTGAIPKGTIFTKKMPRSDIFTDGFIIASASLSCEQLEKKGFGFELKSDAHSDAILEVGQVQSPAEIIDKYKQLQRTFEKTINDFKKSSINRVFIISKEEDPHLYKILSSDEQTVKMQNFGALKDIRDRLEEVRKSLNENSMKKGRISYELADTRKFDNAMLFLGNKGLPFESSKIATLIRIARLKPQREMSLNWDELCMKLSPEAKALNGLIDRYTSLQWIHHFLSC